MGNVFGKAEPNKDYLNFTSEPTDVSVKIRDDLKEAVKGCVLIPQEKEAYDVARDRVFFKNGIGMPLAIVQPECLEDLGATLRYCVENDYQLAPFCGGHGLKAMPDGAVVMDLVKWNKCECDPDAKTVMIQSGSYLAAVDDACKPHGLATTVGTYPLTGSTGLILNGGWGYLAGKFGLAVENMIEVTGFLADGKFVTASKDENPDLFWALRGGGGMFCLVATITLKVYEIPQQILGGLAVYLTPTIKSASALFTKWNELRENLADEETSMICVWPSGAPVTPTSFASFNDTNIETNTDAQKALKLGGWFKVQNTVKLCSYWDDLQHQLDDLNKPGHKYFTGVFTKTLTPKMQEIIIHHSRVDTCKKCQFIVGSSGGKAMTFEPDLPSTMYNGVLVIIELDYTGCTEEVRDGWIAWCRKVRGKLVAEGATMLSHAQEPISDKALDAVYSSMWGEQVKKLREVKQKYDPKNIFRFATALPDTSKPAEAAQCKNDYVK